MKKFIVTIEEMVSNEFELLAENADEAFKVTSEKYKSGEFVLESGNLIAKQMEIYNVTDDEWSDWMEF